LVKAQICKEFGIKPSELRDEDADELLCMFSALALYESTLARKSEIKAKQRIGPRIRRRR